MLDLNNFHQSFTNYNNIHPLFSKESDNSDILCREGTDGVKTPQNATSSLLNTISPDLKDYNNNLDSIIQEQEDEDVDENRHSKFLKSYLGIKNQYTLSTFQQQKSNITNFSNKLGIPMYIEEDHSS